MQKRKRAGAAANQSPARHKAKTTYPAVAGAPACAAAPGGRLEPWKNDTLLRAWLFSELCAADFDALSPLYRSAAAALLWHSKCNPGTLCPALWSLALTAKSRGWFVSTDGRRFVSRPPPVVGGEVSGEPLSDEDAGLALSLLLMYGRNLSPSGMDLYGLTHRSAGVALVIAGRLA